MTQSDLSLPRPDRRQFLMMLRAAAAIGAAGWLTGCGKGSITPDASTDSGSTAGPQSVTPEPPTPQDLPMKESMTWFEKLTGFPEISADQVRKNLTVAGDTMTSKANGKVMTCGTLETPSLAELRERVRRTTAGPGKMTVREVVASVQALHADPANAGALFQVASQFNLLEMVAPGVTPEAGVGRYEMDRTQGPACAIAAGAGTIYRNYFAVVNGQTGQTRDNQIDCLADLGKALGNDGGRLWKMTNGYALPAAQGLDEIDDRLKLMSQDELDRLREKLRIGILWNTQVTLDGCTHRVSQAYCSAVPIAYSDLPRAKWERFARLVLEAAYEATLCAAIVNKSKGASGRVFLTLLGGGAFGNPGRWIMDAIERAISIHRSQPIEVVIVSYGGSDPQVQDLVRRAGA